MEVSRSLSQRFEMFSKRWTHRRLDFKSAFCPFTKSFIHANTPKWHQLQRVGFGVNCTLVTGRKLTIVNPERLIATAKLMSQDQQYFVSCTKSWGAALRDTLGEILTTTSTAVPSEFFSIVLHVIDNEVPQSRIRLDPEVLQSCRTKALCSTAAQSQDDEIDFSVAVATEELLKHGPVLVCCKNRQHHDHVFSFLIEALRGSHTCARFTITTRDIADLKLRIDEDCEMYLSDACSASSPTVIIGMAQLISADAIRLVCAKARSEGMRLVFVAVEDTPASVNHFPFARASELLDDLLQIQKKKLPRDSVVEALFDLLQEKVTRESVTLAVDELLDNAEHFSVENWCTKFPFVPQTTVFHNLIQKFVVVSDVDHTTTKNVAIGGWCNSKIVSTLQEATVGEQLLREKLCSESGCAMIRYVPAVRRIELAGIWTTTAFGVTRTSFANLRRDILQRIQVLVLGNEVVDCDVVKADYQKGQGVCFYTRVRVRLQEQTPSVSRALQQVLCDIANETNLIWPVNKTDQSSCRFRVVQEPDAMVFSNEIERLLFAMLMCQSPALSLTRGTRVIFTKDCDSGSRGQIATITDFVTESPTNDLRRFFLDQHLTTFLPVVKTIDSNHSSVRAE